MIALPHDRATIERVALTGLLSGTAELIESAPRLRMKHFADVRRKVIFQAVEFARDRHPEPTVQDVYAALRELGEWNEAADDPAGYVADALTEPAVLDIPYRQAVEWLLSHAGEVSA